MAIFALALAPRMSSKWSMAIMLLTFMMMVEMLTLMTKVDSSYNQIGNSDFSNFQCENDDL
jgi:hypothetical protein